jgi:predicted RNA-binding protein (virulence factor B family)
MARIGTRNKLAVVREAPPGVYLDGQELGEILLPRRYVPARLRPGDELEVFVYLDSEDRLVATTESPRAMVGEIACLEVVGVNRDVGAFLNWGLAKDLLLPFREQERPLRRGEKVVVAIYVDEKTNRIAASMRVQRHLSKRAPEFRPGEAVELLVSGKTPLGYNAIVENTHFGLLHYDRVRVPLEVGQRVKGFVRGIRPGGKIDLSLDAAGYKRVAPLKVQIVEALKRKGGRFELDDDSSVEAIREEFGVSKKAFKQALGALYKMRRIRFLKPGPGVELVEETDWEPGGGI